MKILIIGTKPRALINFRGALLKKMLANGHDVVAMSDDSDAKSRQAVEALGIRYLPYTVARSGLNPLKDLGTFRELRRAIQQEAPDRILAYTIKPVVWGGLAARSLRHRRFYALITGLGFAFEGTGVKGRLLRSLVSGLYRSALLRAQCVIFQNNDNRQLFVDGKIVGSDLTRRVYGSGVDLEAFAVTPLPEHPPIVFLCIARLLSHKGIREYALAAKHLKQQHANVRCLLVGASDPSPDGIPLAEVEAWHDDRFIEYLGESSDVRVQLAKCHVYVLPSYHEGMPRTVLEAMAMGRPILTTDVPGCRDTVIADQNGFLVPKADAGALAERMEWFLRNHEQLKTMGAASRKIAKDSFDVHRVNDELINIMELST